MTYELHHADCVDFLPTVPDGSIDCVFVDWPYFGVVGADWDNQWKTRADYIAWIVEQAKQFKRICKMNSSIFLFCDEKMEAYIQVALDEYFLLLNKIVWYKTNNLPQKNAHLLRTFAPMTERAMFYTVQQDITGLEAVKLDIDNFSTLRGYFRDFQNALSMSKKKIIEIVGQKADHSFRYDSTQWDLPTPETYAQLCELLPPDFLRREYEDLRREYEDLRREYEDLRRPFNASKNTLDVISGPIVSQSDNTNHPTTKPKWLYKKIIQAITNPGQVVLDCCMGSGTSGEVCIELGRNFIGCELYPLPDKPIHERDNPDYFSIAQRRCAEASLQPALFQLDTPPVEKQADLL